MTYDRACELIATIMNEWFATDPEAGQFTAEGIAKQLDGRDVEADAEDPMAWYPYLAMEILLRSGSVEDALPRVLAAIDALLERLRSGPTKRDRKQHWTEESAEEWIAILTETRAKLLRPSSKPRDLWIVGGVARQLDAMGLTEGELAEALYSVASHVAQLPDSKA